MNRQNHIRIIYPFLVMFLMAALTTGILIAVSMNGRAGSYWIQGEVLSADQDIFIIEPDPEESSLKNMPGERALEFDLRDFEIPSVLPEAGQTVRITCTDNMKTLIGLYELDDEGNWNMLIQPDEQDEAL